MTLAVAHRGDSLRFRENTMAALTSAVELGADWVEVDVKVTRDGVPVLLHDDTLLRLWQHDRRIDTLSRAEVGALSGGRIPELREALEYALGRGTPLMLDTPRVDEARAALALVRRLDCLERVVFTGPPQALCPVRESAPAALIAMSWESPLPPRPELLRRVRPDYLNPYHRWLTPGRVARLHARGMRVSTWTVDRAPAMAALAAAGVDAIISNDLRALRRVLAPALAPVPRTADRHPPGRARTEPA